MCNYSHGEVLLVAQEAVRVLLAQEACGSVVAPGSVVAWAGAPGAGGLWQKGAATPILRACDRCVLLEGRALQLVQAGGYGRQIPSRGSSSYCPQCWAIAKTGH